MLNSIMKSLACACALIGAQAHAETLHPGSPPTPQERSAELTFLHSDGLTFVDIDASSGLIFLEVELNGRKVPALLDNGSDTTMIDSRLARELRIALGQVDGSATTGRGSISMRQTNGAELTVPKQFRIFAPFWSSDLSVISKTIGTDIGVILGGDILNNVSYLIDPFKNRMLFAQSGTLNFGAPNLIKIPFENGVVEGMVDGKKAALRFDLGSTSDLRIARHRRDHFLGDAPLTNLGRSIDGAGIEGQNRGLKNVPFEVSGMTSQVDVKIIDDLGQTVDGYIGLPFFRDKVVLIDQPNQEITVFPKR